MGKGVKYGSLLGVDGKLSGPVRPELSGDNFPGGLPLQPPPPLTGITVQNTVGTRSDQQPIKGTTPHGRATEGPPE